MASIFFVFDSSFRRGDLIPPGPHRHANTKFTREDNQDTFFFVFRCGVVPWWSR
jgi:hypothetical protein